MRSVYKKVAVNSSVDNVRKHVVHQLQTRFSATWYRGRIYNTSISTQLSQNALLYTITFTQCNHIFHYVFNTWITTQQACVL